MSNQTDYPKATILEIQDLNDGVTVLCQLNKTVFKNEKWIDDNWLGYLKIGNSFLDGRWHKSGSDWSFQLKNKQDASRLSKNQILDCLDGYYGERALIVLSGFQWEQRTLNENKDHDHCGICWETIGGGESHMFSSEKDSVCVKCYETYVKPKSIAFIEEWAK